MIPVVAACCGSVLQFETAWRVTCLIRTHSAAVLRCDGVAASRPARERELSSRGFQGFKRPTDKTFVAYSAKSMLSFDPPYRVVHPNCVFAHILEL